MPMKYPVARGGLFGGGGMTVYEEKAELSCQELEYLMVRERNRTILANHAMHNTDLLMRHAIMIMQENPATAEPLREIMAAYTESIAESIRSYGQHDGRRR